MSNQQQHTAGPLTDIFEVANGYGIGNGESRVFKADDMEADTRMEEHAIAKANAERIAACWNACLAIPTYQLFGTDDEPNDLGGMIDHLRSQRDDLVKALEAIKEKCRPGQQIDIHAAADLICEIFNDADAALSKARGQS